MSTHRCSYCLKPIPTALGIMWHVSQAPACWRQWRKALEEPVNAKPVDNETHGTAIDDTCDPEDWQYELDQDGPCNLHEGHFIQQHGTCNEPLPFDLGEPQSKRARVEESVNDTPNRPSEGHFTKQFVGIAAKILGSGRTVFESMEAVEAANERSQWAPFHNEEEWELACFLMKNVGQTKMDEFLKLDIYMDRLRTGPGWACEMIDVEGDIVAEDGTLRHEQLELWRPFWDVMSYVPERAYTDTSGENHIYDEMWTGDWWWDVQTKLPDGAVVAPIILSLDKTTLSQFSGDKKAWPVYLTIGNISEDVRCQVSVHATVLIGYLPVSKLECFQKKNQLLAGYRLFHHSMSLLLRPLADAGHHGREMSNKHGDLEECASRSMDDTYKTLQCMKKNKQSRKFDAEGLRAVFDPFWKELPFTDIFTCLTPDILHQLHKGIFHDHLVQWCMSIVGEKEIDARFQAMTQYPALRHFKKGISSVSQWTGTEHKEMQRVFVGLLAGAVEDRVLMVARSLLDFIYYAQLQQHTDTTLIAMEESLKSFHEHKHVLIELELREDFNMLKIHSMQHYISSIRALGSADGYNTEYPERLHINYAKDGYRASNKCDYMEQMALWLQCQEAVHYKSAYLAWRKSQDGNSDFEMPHKCFLSRRNEPRH
ncbi:hypothetical protein EDD17DRAFT_1512153 [Pisolithus thermaeus]|nr:hypothetical protein EDD17DRAFT_1512153 [Pisolithus thermaeus]